MFILESKGAEQAYTKAAQVFQQLYEQVTGICLPIRQTPDEHSDMVVIGSDTVQPFAFRKLAKGFPLRFQTDDYCIISSVENKRNLLFLAGGRGRSTLYAVYDFFERRAGCHYFWDGDIIPQKDTIDISGLNVQESPRFTYRAIRYFAHRGLHRFQAEHWDFEDWQQEIDWICKSRLNIFMLRIGMDDLFQKAFPDIVESPSNEKPSPDALPGFNDRTTFWPLTYRGQLRQKILAYAFSCDLLHPEDCGTMTHWYSRTPNQFLDKVNPGFLSQTSKSQSDRTGLVWDIFDERNLKNYQRLTDTHVTEYGRPDIFHTIGLAERTYSPDRRVNLELKKYAYRKIIDYVSRKYPNAPLLVATWDFFHALHPEEARELIKLLDPEKTILLDYTVDLKAAGNDFENWDIMGKIPWIFGIFHAYARQSHVHGDYEYISRKLSIADSDPFCKGLAFWPELSHSDTLMLAYFTENAWRPSKRGIGEIADTLCHKRYGVHENTMADIWHTFLPTLKLPTRSRSGCFSNLLNTYSDFGVLLGADAGQQAAPEKIQTENKDPSKNREPARRRFHPCYDLLNSSLPPETIIKGDFVDHREAIEKIWQKHGNDAEAFAPDMARLISKIRDLPPDVFEIPFIRRDTVDMVRTVISKKLHYDYIQTANLLLAWRRGEDTEQILRDRLDYCEKLLDIFGDVLGLCEEYSLWRSLLRLEKNRAVNPYFENTLKENALSDYCRTTVYEAVKYVYLRDAKVYRNWIVEQLDGDNRNDNSIRESFDENKKEILEEFKALPLSKMYEGEKPDYRTVMERLLEMFA